MNLVEGKIDVDSEFAKEIGFTSENFTNFSWLWGFPKDNVIWVSMVVSLKRGAFKQMMEGIERKGIIFRIPTPMGRM